MIRPLYSRIGRVRKIDGNQVGIVLSNAPLTGRGSGIAYKFYGVGTESALKTKSSAIKNVRSIDKCPRQTPRDQTRLLAKNAEIT